MKRIETRYEWSDNAAYVRFTTHFVSEKGTLHNYDGNFFWNPEQSSLAMWYMDPRNEIVQGPVTVNGDETQMTFAAKGFDGKAADFRVTVTRKTNDDYNWLPEQKLPDSWKPVRCSCLPTEATPFFGLSFAASKGLAKGFAKQERANGVAR